MPASIFKFGPYQLDRKNFELRRNGESLKLDRTPLELLFLLVENAGSLVTHEEAIERVWGKEVFIEAETSLYTAVRKIRRALGDDTEEPQYVQTVSRKGYRFVAKVEGIDRASTGTQSASLSTGSRVSAGVSPASKNTEWKSWRTLRFWALALGSFAAAAAIAWMGKYQREPNRVMLAVLPLQNFSGDPQQEYLADGVTEEIITELGSLDPKRLGVIARTSSMKYKSSTKDIAQISRELRVDYVIEGSIRRSGNSIRVTGQLIRSADQTHLWAQSYDGELGDVLKLESNIALEVAAQIRLALSEETRERLSATARVNPEAHESYLLALQGWDKRNREGFVQAISQFTRATEIDPHYAPAFAGLARVYSLAPIFADMPADEAVPRALDAANRALSLDETLADAHSSLAFTRVHYLHDWTSAEKEFRRAIELEPNNPYGHFFYSNSFLSPVGRHDEAIAEVKKTIELDPLSTRFQCFAGRTYVWARRYDDAVTQFERVNQLDPNFALNHERLAHLYAMLGKLEDAISEEAKARTLTHESAENVQEKIERLRRASAQYGAQGYWQTELDLAHDPQNPPEAYDTSLGLAVIYSHLGDKEKAFRFLEAAYAERDEELTNLAVEPQFDLLRSDLRFKDLVSRVGIPNR
jgi:TolB-like protein/DNA-binding winged helix-turn-helix (wHTH) protein/Tfp pilus assembly protein PilF